MGSIRGRLTLMLVLSIGLLLIGTGVLLYAVIRSHLVREFDRALLAKGQALITLTKDIGRGVELDFADEFMPEFNAPDNPEYFSLRFATGALLEKSRSLGTQELPRLPGLSNEPVFRNLMLPNGLRGRQMQTAFVPQVEDAEDLGEDEKQDKEHDADHDPLLDPAQFPDRAMVLLLARDRTRLDALLDALRMTIAAVIVVVVGVMMGLVRVALRRGLRPLDDIREQVAHLDEHSLDTRLQMLTKTQELAPVVDQLNALLQRLAAAFARERQFSSDVAHELRTPVAELRTLTEVGLRWPDDREAIAHYFTDAHEISLQMERVVHTLLTLTRCESGTQQIRRVTVNLLELVDTCWLTVKQTAQQKSLVFHCDVSSSYMVTTDRDVLIMVLSNLLSNAVTYSSSPGQIGCIARQDGTTIRLIISNPTDRLTHEDLPHLFERFWRKDPARSDASHAGLGLSVVEAFSNLLGLNVRAELHDQHIFSITMSLQLSGMKKPS